MKKKVHVLLEPILKVSPCCAQTAMRESTAVHVHKSAPIVQTEPITTKRDQIPALFAHPVNEAVLMLDLSPVLSVRGANTVSQELIYAPVVLRGRQQTTLVRVTAPVVLQVVLHPLQDYHLVWPALMVPIRVHRDNPHAPPVLLVGIPMKLGLVTVPNVKRENMPPMKI
jgi:hypothetical protein